MKKIDFWERLLHSFDLSAKPFVPSDCQLESNKDLGRVIIKDLVLCDFNKRLSIEDALKDPSVAEEFLANARFLEILLIRKEVLLEEWWGKVLLFGSSIYGFNGKRFVRGLYFDGISWESRYYCLELEFLNNYALVALTFK